MATTVERPQRADARRNREAILKAARHVFGREGAGAQMDDIARRAKLGVGTLYRHFPTKEALFAALATDHFERVTALAREAAQIEDPWLSFEQLLVGPGQLMITDRSVAEVVSASPASMTAAKDQQTELFEVAGAIMSRAQAAGVLRPDARPSDIGLVMRGLCQQCGSDPGDADRYLRIALDGFRTQAALAPLPIG
jgi:AcrR family transcriptional regulator